MSNEGFPFTTRMSAFLPGSNVPIWSAIQQERAELLVAETIASIGDKPTST